MSDSNANDWTVKPEETTIDLVYKRPDGTERGFWIRVRNELNVGEARRVTTAGWRGMSSTQAKNDDPKDAERQTEISIDWRAQTFARTQAYLLDWSLTKDGVPMTRDGIESLKPEVYEVIENAITAHKEAMDAAKKRPAGSSVPSTMSA